MTVSHGRLNVNNQQKACSEQNHNNFTCPF